MPRLTKKQVDKVDVDAISRELQSLQRQRAVVLKSRIMQENRIRAIVAGTIGYSTTMTAAERTKKFTEAGALIKSVLAEETEHVLASVIRVTMIGINAFEEEKDRLEKVMRVEAKKLPVATWVEHRDQRGFGLLFLAIVIGETGNLALYANPAKVWRRLGCAPWTFNSKTQMGATWRGGKQGKLPAEEWELFGYSPRRRSISYLVGKNLLMQNYIDGEWTGPYRARYEEAKANIQETHPDYSARRCDLHGMLLATKLLLKNLWVRWNGNPPREAL